MIAAFILFWEIGFMVTCCAYLTRLKRDYFCGHKSWLDFSFTLGRLPIISKIFVGGEILVCFNLFLVAWPLYWFFRLIDKVTGI